MLSFKNFGGKLVAVLHDGPKKKDIYLHEEEVPHGFRSYEAKEGETLLRGIDPKTERTICYVVGASGQGKSYWTAQFARQYHSRWPDRDIFVLSALDDDPTLDKVCGKYVKRLKLKSKEFLETPIDTADFRGSLVISDDIDCIRDKAVLKKCQAILDGILTTGRHFNISLVVTAHTPCNGASTKLVLAEAHSLTLYPRGMGNRTSKYLLGEHFGLSKDEAEHLKQLKERSVTFIRQFPSCFVTDSRIWTR